MVIYCSGYIYEPLGITGDSRWVGPSVLRLVYFLTLNLWEGQDLAYLSKSLSLGSGDGSQGVICVVSLYLAQADLEFIAPKCW